MGYPLAKEKKQYFLVSRYQEYKKRITVIDKLDYRYLVGRSKSPYIDLPRQLDQSEAQQTRDLDPKLV